jgi:hypothetical protein
MTGKLPDDKPGWFKSDAQRAAVITGVLALIAALVAALIAAVVMTNNAVQSAGSGTSGPALDVAPLTGAPSASAAAGSPPAPVYVEASPLLYPGEPIPGADYTVGMCFDFTRHSGFDVLDYEPCVRAHNGQIVALLNASGSPSLAAASSQLDTFCQSIVTSLAKPSDVAYRWYLQFPDDYTSGDRAYECLALTSVRTNTTLITW